MKKILGTLAEQGAYTGGFFITQVIAARTLNIDDFALFSALYSTVILLSIVHACTAADILLIYGRPGKSLAKRSLFNILLPVITIAALTTAYFSFTVDNASVTLLMPLFFMAFIMYWSLRSIAILNHRSLGLLIPPLLQVAALSTLLFYSSVSLTFTLALITLCLSIPTLIFWKILNTGLKYKIQSREWISFSISNSAAQVILWTMTHGMVIFLLAQDNTTASAYFRIVMTLILPAQYFGIALSNHYLPQLIKLHTEHRKSYYIKCSQLATMGIGVSIAYSSLLILGGNHIPALIFGEDFKNIDLSSLALLPVSLAVIQSGRTILKSSNLNHYVLLAMLIGFSGFALHFTLNHHTLNTNTMLLGVNLTAVTLVLFLLLTLYFNKTNTPQGRT